jgi:hypothetical protein
MGSDNFHHKRRARAARSFKRKLAKRAPYDMVLIVCEGEKTEPNYFRALIDDLQLNTANIRIAKNTAGSSPRNVVDTARKEYKKEKDYDAVYCVFDKDQHQSYAEALDIIRREKARGKRGCPIYAITSIPCFEFWILLHFTYTTKGFDTGHGSICGNVISDLKKFLPDYEKGEANTYLIIKDRIPKAISNAKKTAAYCKSSGTDTPSTEMYLFVEYLQQLKK